MFCLLPNIRRARVTLKRQNHSFNESPRGQKSIRIFFPCLAACSTFFLTRCQISKSKLSSSGNQGLYSTTVWRQASMHWHETESPWILNKWWSKVEKWWGFPAVCPITPYLATSVGPSHSIRNTCEFQVPVRVPLVAVFFYRPGPGGSESTKRKQKRKRLIFPGLYGKPIKP